MEILHHFESCYHLMKPAEENSPEAFAWYSGLSHPLFNAVMHLSSLDPALKLDLLLEKAPEGAPLSFWVHPENHSAGLESILKARAFEPALICSLMARRVAPVSEPKYEIRKADRDLFHQICASNFHFDEVFAKGYADLLDGIDAENYLVCCDGKPVGTGTLFPFGKLGGIFNISTMTEYRNRGCATSMMLFLMNRACELELEQLILLSSKESEKIYQDLQFETAMEIEIYTRRMSL